MGNFTVVTGPMFAGKSTELIRRIRRERIAEREVQLFKYEQDARYAAVEQIATFDGSTILAQPVGDTRTLMRYVRPEAQMIVIDELQFFDDIIIDYVMHLVDEGRHVLAACLNLDFRGEPFPFPEPSKRTMADLIVRADNIVHLSAVCMHRDEAGRRCGREATRTQRNVNGVPASYSDPIKLIGAQESYEVRCPKHHAVRGKACPMPHRKHSTFVFNQSNKSL